MERIRQTLAQCLEAAGEIQRRHFAALSAEQMSSKSAEFDIVTVADTESEQAILELITRDFPGHAILTEERGRLDRPGASVRWVIDPLDGTTNYSHGVPIFCISIAVEFEGEARLAAIYNPVREERFLAERGQGATLNGRPIHVSPRQTLADSLITTGFPYDRRERIDRYMAFFRAFTMRTHGVLRLGSAALDLCAVAAGQLEAYYEESLHPWDWAAGQLLVQEAGGRVTDYHGEDRFLERRQLCASNGAVHQEMLAVLGAGPE